MSKLGPYDDLVNKYYAYTATIGDNFYYIRNF